MPVKNKSRSRPSRKSDIVVKLIVMGNGAAKEFGVKNGTTIEGLFKQAGVETVSATEIRMLGRDATLSTPITRDCLVTVTPNVKNA